MEAGGTEAGGGTEASVRRALDWVAARQILDVVGDWARARPDVRPGGWPFEYRNDYYPDVDDTAVIICRAASCRPRALPGRDRARHRMGAGPAERGRRLGLVRCRQHPPLSQQHPVRRSRRPARPADRRSDRALRLDAGAAGLRPPRPGDRAALDFLRREQEADGSWFGRWGTNYIYGTWSVLCALNAVGEDPRRRMCDAPSPG